MLKRGAFINKRFNRFLLGNIWGWIAYSVNLMSDSLISGNRLGETSLQAVSIVYPLFSVVFFFSYLFAPGASIIFGKKIGEFKQEEAYRAAGTSLVSSAITGLLLSIALLLIKQPFLSLYGLYKDAPAAELFNDASSYYNWIVLFAVLSPIEAAFNYLVTTDGEAVLITVGGVSEITVNVAVSLTLSGSMGVSGLGIANCMGVTVKILSHCMHFLRKTNNVHFHFCLDIKTAARSVALGFSRYMMYLFMAVVDILMNKIIIASCGIDYIPAYSVVNLVFSVCEMFGSVNDAGVGFVTCFLGEKNKHDMDIVLRKTTRTMFIMAAGISVFFFCTAPLMPVIYGLQTQKTVEVSVLTARIMALAPLGFGACYLASELSCSMEKPGQATFILLLKDIAAPLPLSLLLGRFFGFTGIAVGMSLSPYAAFGIYALISIRKRGRQGFPVYFEDSGEEAMSYDFSISTDTITVIRDTIYTEMSGHGYEVGDFELLMEEFFTRMSDINTGKAVLAECTLLFGKDKARIIIRDDGALFNFLDENNEVDSLNAYVFNRLLECTKEKNYTLTTSFNRSGFAFGKHNI